MSHNCPRLFQDNDTINGAVFEALNAGFSDTAKAMREHTLKSMLALVVKLNEANLNDRLMRTLGKLQSDPEPSIRTNTTIFYGKVAPRLSEAIRVRAIVPAFLKAMKDPFPYARLAAVRSTSACKAFYDPALVCVKIMPEVCALLLDPYGPVREAASDCLASLLEVVRLQQGKMKVEEDARKAKHEEEAAAKREAEGPKIGEIASPAAPPAAVTPSKQSAGGGTTPQGMKLSSGAVGEGTESSIAAPSSMGFRTPSDSSFWDAIDDEDAPLPENGAPTPASGGGGGWDDGWGDSDGLDELDDEATSSTKPPAASATSPSPPLFPPSAKKSVEERRAEAKRRKEEREVANTKKLPVGEEGGGEDWEW